MKKDTQRVETNKYTFQYHIYKHKAKIDYLGVRKKFQHQGIGSQIVKDFIEKCKNLGIRIIEIDCYNEAISFWEKLGFVIQEEPQIIGGYIQDYHDGFLKIK